MVKTFKEMGKKKFYVWNDDIANAMGSFWSNELVLLHWASKNWKSMYTMSIANENGKRWTKTAYFSLELWSDVLKMQQSCIRAWIDRKKFEDWTYSKYQRDKYSEHYEWFEDNFKLYDSTDLFWLPTLDNVCKKIEELYINDWRDLFIIDSLKAITWKTGSQNDFEILAINKLKEVKNKLPICIVLIHHNNKTGEDFSWAQDLENFSDRRIMIKKELEPLANWTTLFHQTRITIHKERLWNECEFLFNWDKWNLTLVWNKENKKPVKENYDDTRK